MAVATAHSVVGVVVQDEHVFQAQAPWINAV